MLLCSQALASVCVKYPAAQVSGNGPLPYNYRIIDGHIHAGGHPLNPATHFNNSDAQVMGIFNYLKGQGIKTIVNLENSRIIYQRYKKLLAQADLQLLHVPMSMTKKLSKAEWQKIKAALQSPVYVHCKWGADRTGMIIAKYLVEEKGYSSSEAVAAVITGGSHAGVLGGLKRIYILNAIATIKEERR